MGNRKNYSKISTEGAKAKQAEEIKIESTLELNATEKVEPKVEVLKGVVINCERLNVRTNPSLNATVETVIKKGTEVEIADSNDDFYYVSSGTMTDGFDGWCMKKYISVQK